MAARYLRAAALAMLAARACAVAAPSPLPQPPMPLHLVSWSNVQAAGGGVCLDGSQPGFYYHLPQPSHKGKWRLHFCGGGWCTSSDSCAQRANSGQGSSNSWAPLINETAGFDAWGLIFIAYCDGTSYTSNRDDPMQYNGQQLYFRGRRVLDALLLEWEGMFGLLSDSSEVIVSGTSAGGLATYLHAATIAAAMTSNATHVVALPDAGFFLNHPNMNNQPAFAEGFMNAVGPNLWNATGSLPPACVQRFGQAAAWNCMFVAEFYSEVAAQVPFFILNSLIDFAQITGILQLGCNPSVTGACNATQLAALQAYADSQQAAVEAAVTPRDGYFLPSCYIHELSCRDYDFMGITVPVGNDTRTPNQTFTTWYYNLTDGPTRVVDVPFPGDPTCINPGVWHGTC